MVPQVEGPEAAAQAIDYAKYPPLGNRGIAPWFSSMLGIEAGDVIKNANSETILILQMESLEAYERLDETLALENFEVLLVGPNDLSASIGKPGQIHNSKTENIMIDVAERMKGTGKALATTFADPEDCRRWIGAGYRMMNVSSTLVLGTVRTKQLYAEFREQFG